MLVFSYIYKLDRSDLGMGVDILMDIWVNAEDIYLGVI